MLRLSQVDQSPEPIALGDRAKEDLRFIRQTMERGAAFTAVPGWGGVGMGFTALAAAVLASRQPTAEGWLLVWILEAMLAVAIGAVAIHRKARRADLPVLSGAGRKFVLSFLPPALAGAVLTVALWQAGADSLLPGAWLLLFGVLAVNAWQAWSISTAIANATILVFLGAGSATATLMLARRAGPALKSGDESRSRGEGYGLDSDSDSDRARARLDRPEGSRLPRPTPYSPLLGQL
jgi:hypothetical protein